MEKENSTRRREQSAISDLCKLEESKRKEINQSLEEFTRKGYRVLAAKPKAVLLWWE